MAKEIVNIGTQPNDNTGDPLRDAFSKINDNFSEIYNGLGDGTDLGLTVTNDDNVEITNDLTVNGDLIVQGTTVTLNTETVQFEDNILLLNRASNDTQYNTTNAGIEVEVTGTTNQTFLYTYGDSRWDLSDSLNITGDLTVDTNTLYVDSTNNRVGIGTASPDTITEIVGDNPILTIRDTDTSSSTATATIRFAESGAGDVLGNYWDIGYSPVNLLNFDYMGSTKMTIDSSGNVGIGINPSEKLDIEGSGSNIAVLLNRSDAATSGSIKIEAGNNTNNIYSTGSKDLTISTNSVERMRIDSSGVVQVRNQTPTIQLYNTDTAVTLNQTLGDIDWYQSDPSDQGVGTVAKIRAVNVGSIAGYGELAFHTGSATSIDERLRIDYQGNLGLGTDSPSSVLHIANTTPEIYLEDTNAGSGDAKLLANNGNLGLFADVNNEFASSIIYFNVDGSEKMRILSSGGITFNGDTATANALDDYEEGTFTPEFADAATGGNTASPSDANGSYVKVGSMVTISLQLQNLTIAALTGTNNAYIRGLPFSAKNLTGAIKFNATARINIFSANANNMQTTVELGDNTNYMYFIESLTNSGNAVIATVNQFSGGSDIFLTMTYFAD